MCGSRGVLCVGLDSRSVLCLDFECVFVRYAVAGVEEGWSDMMCGSSSNKDGPGIVSIKR